MMIVRSSAIFASLLAVAHGFSTINIGATAPQAAPRAPTSVLKQASPILRGSRSPWTALSMSDASFGDVSSPTGNNNMNGDSGSSYQQKTTTQLEFSASEMTMELDNENTSPSPFIKMGDNIAQTFQQLDINEIVNTSVVILLSMAILYKLTMVDAGMTRGWYPEEIAGRLTADNWSGYLHVLHDNPIATKAVTSATVYTIGDVIAQRTEGVNMGELDRPRIVRSLLAGLIGHGPMSHVWYQVSENFFDHVLQLTQWWSFIPKVIVDQGFWGPIWYEHIW